jgi:hypothetical protein
LRPNQGSDSALPFADRIICVRIDFIPALPTIVAAQTSKLIHHIGRRSSATIGLDWRAFSSREIVNGDCATTA